MIRNRPTRARRGFSLIELLTVIAIMAVLAAILVGVLVSVRSGASDRATAETLNKLEAAIDQQVKFQQEAAKKERQQRADTFTRLVPFCNNDEDRAEALLVLVKVRLQFPQTFAEATTGVDFGLGAQNVYRPSPVFRTVTGVTLADQQAAVLLYLSLSERSAADGQNTDQISQSELAGTGYKVFRDAWGTHIAFSRFAQNAELNQPKYAPRTGSADPFDPRGKLAGNWTNKTTAQNALGMVFNGQNRVVTAWSAGKDKAFGTIANALTTDDVFAYRTRQQGSKAD